MRADINDVEIGLVTSLGVLREVLRGLNINGRRWWVASGSHEAAERGYISIAHGTRHCFDPLNTLHFRFPVVGNGECESPTQRLILMIEPSTIEAEEPPFYLHNGRILEDSAQDFHNFYQPLERALIARFQARI